MGPGPRRHQALSPARAAGSGYLEFAVAVIVIAVLSLFLLDALERTAREAERTMLRIQAVQLRTAFMLQRLQHLQAGTPEVDLAGANPVAWLDRPPGGYLGELETRPEPLPGHWYFDLDARELVYMRRDGGEHAFAVVARQPAQGQPAQPMLKEVARAAAIDTPSPPVGK